MTQISEESTAQIASKLKEYLRERLNENSLKYVLSPIQIQGGKEAGTFKFQINSKQEKLNQCLVLRLCHESYSSEQLFLDSKAQNLLGGLEIPVAKVHFTCVDKSILGGAFLIMDFIPGKVLWTAPNEKISGILADSHLALHKVDPLPLIQSLDNLDFEKNRYLFNPITLAVENLPRALPWVNKIEKWLIDHQLETEQLAICHGDFHPNNILIQDDQVKCILDWHLSVGDPAQDVIQTIQVLTINSKLFAPKTEWRNLDNYADMYLKTYQKQASVDGFKFDYYRVVNCLRDLGNGYKYGGPMRTHPFRVNTQCEMIQDISGIKILMPN